VDLVPGHHDLDVLVGEWSVELPSPDGSEATSRGRSVFEWVLGRSYLLQRTEAPVPEAPDTLAVVSAADDGFLLHYYDSRGVTRLYEMTLAGGVWRLERNAADFSPLPFHQRFTGTFSDDRTVVHGTWETSPDGVSWERDFDLVYRRRTV
jgi:hypothetical protein